VSSYRDAILGAAAARSTSAVAHAIVSGLRTPHVVLARLWLMDQSGDLRLAASAGNPSGGGAYNALDGSFSRVRHGVGKIGQIAAAREAVIVPSIRGDEDWISNPEWIARQGVRAFFGLPLLRADRVHGVLAVFERSSPPRERAEDLRFLADYTAARLAEVGEHGKSPRPVHAAFAPTNELTAPARPPIVTREDLRALERETIANALTQTSGRIFGPRGAAVLLGMKPTTLASRIKVLGLRMR